MEFTNHNRLIGNFEVFTVLLKEHFEIRGHKYNVILYINTKYELLL